MSLVHYPPGNQHHIYIPFQSGTNLSRWCYFFPQVLVGYVSEPFPGRVMEQQPEQPPRLKEVLPRSLTWNLKISRWKRRFILETIIFRFHVKFRGVYDQHLSKRCQPTLSLTVVWPTKTRSPWEAAMCQTSWTLHGRKWCLKPHSLRCASVCCCCCCCCWGWGGKICRKVGGSWWLLLREGWRRSSWSHGLDLICWMFFFGWFLV